MRTLDGLEIVVSQYKVGAKKACLFNGRLVVSPAMFELISKAESQEELKRILASIPVINIGTFDPLSPEFVLPMTTESTT